MAKTTFRGALRSGSEGNEGYALLQQAAIVEFTSATDDSFEVFTLPADARVIDFIVKEGSVTVTNASINIGTADTADYFADEVVLSGIAGVVEGGLEGSGLLATGTLGEETPVFVGIGDTNATDGSAEIICIYSRDAGRGQS